MKTVSQFLIYGLEDPRTGEVRYIGRSSNGLRRPKDHATPSYLRVEGRTHKTNWIRSLLREGLEPDIRVLRECLSMEETFAAERELIAEHRAKGARLTNRSDGGAGPFGCVRSEEFKRNLSEARRGVPRPEWVKERMREGHKSEVLSEERREHVRRLGVSWKGKTRSEETRAKMSAAKKAWHAEHHAEHAATMLRVNTSRVATDAQRERCRALGLSLRGKPKSAETRVRMSEGKRLGWARKKFIQAAEAIWAS